MKVDEKMKMGIKRGEEGEKRWKVEKMLEYLKRIKERRKKREGRIQGGEKKMMNM